MNNLEGTMMYETTNLELSEQGSLYQKVFEDGEWQRNQLIGKIEDCSYDIPQELENEYEELSDIWEDISRQEYLEI